jgi:transcriptional regulator with XRE-family HTH domain
MEFDASQLRDFDRRRRALGISVEMLSRRSGVSRAVVQRILSGKHATASFANIAAIATSLGLSIRFEDDLSVEKMRRDQASKKARKLVSLVQGTSGIEGQAVDRQAIESMVERTTHELLAGSKSKLWSEV